MSEQIPEINEQQDTEELFNKILSNPDACERLFDTFYSSLDTYEDLAEPDPVNFSKVLLSAYHDRNINPLLLELCHRSMFDLLREADIIPRRLFSEDHHTLDRLTDRDGKLLQNIKVKVSPREYEKFKSIWQKHEFIEKSAMFLADGYDSDHYYDGKLEMEEDKYDRTIGILKLYRLPDTIKLNWTRAKTYAEVWDAFRYLQNVIPSSIVYYGQETREADADRFDELGVLIPIHGLEKHIIKDLDIVDKVVVEYRQYILNK